MLEPGCELRVAFNSPDQLPGIMGSSKWRKGDKKTWNGEVVTSPFNTSLPPNHLCLLVKRNRQVDDSSLDPTVMPTGTVPRALPAVPSRNIYLKLLDPSKPCRRRYNGVVRWAARAQYKWPAWSIDEDSEHGDDPGIDRSQYWQAFRGRETFSSIVLGNSIEHYDDDNFTANIEPAALVRV